MSNTKERLLPHFQTPRKELKIGRVAGVFLIIVNKAEWFGNPANIKGANKDAKIWVRRSMTVQTLLVCAHTLCMSYVSR